MQMSTGQQRLENPLRGLKGWEILTQGALRDPGLWLDNGVAVEEINDMPVRVAGHHAGKSYYLSVPTLTPMLKNPS